MDDQKLVLSICPLPFNLQVCFRSELRDALIVLTVLTLFDMGGGGMMAPQNVFDHCAQTLRRRKNLVTFNINLCSIKKSYFWFPRLSGVTIATSLSGSTQDFLKLSFRMFPYNEILKVFKSKN